MPRDGGAKEWITRRGFVRGALVAGVASLATVSGYSVPQTLRGQRTIIPRETFLYVNPEGTKTPVWFVERGLVGREARLSHFHPGDGANVLWRWHVDDSGGVAGGVPALLMHVKEEKVEFPRGYPVEEFVIEGLYAVFNVCPHAGCRPGWKLVPREEQCDDPGYETIFCPCHYSHFHPTRISVFQHPSPPEGNGVRYLGVAEVSGPSGRGMPLIPIEIEEDVIKGRLREASWYRYGEFARRRNI